MQVYIYIYIYTYMCTSLINRVFNYDFQHAVYIVLRHNEV